MPFEGGLTKTMADAENPEWETSYQSVLNPYDDFPVVSVTKYYLMKYKHMKVNACASDCGKNGFQYVMLWKR